MRLWSYARFDLGLSGDEFLDLHPKQLGALTEREKRKTVHTEFLFAQVVTEQINWSIGAPKERVQPKMFMPSEWSKRPAKKKRRSEKDFTKGMERTMERAMRYQAAQVKRELG